MTGTALQDKIQNVLTEARMVLPGVQAMLGFQFITVFLDAFKELPQTAQYLYFVSLGLFNLSIILLMTPAIYHRIVENGESTEDFHRFAGRMLVCAMSLLGAGISLDAWLLSFKAFGSVPLAFFFSAAVFAILFFLLVRADFCQKNPGGLNAGA